MLLLNKLQSQIKEAQEKLKIIEAFPDLDERTDRYGISRLVSTKANHQVTEVETRFGCDCCADAELLAFPFLIVENHHVYSNPPCFVIGKKKESGIDVRRGWEDDFFDNDLPAEIILKIQEHLTANSAS